MAYNTRKLYVAKRESIKIGFVNETCGWRIKGTEMHTVRVVPFFSKLTLCDFQKKFEIAKSNWFQAFWKDLKPSKIVVF